jgi:hypothetical protein
MRIRQTAIEDSAVIAQLMSQLMEASGYQDWQEFYRQHGFSHEAVLFELEFEKDGT